MDQTQLFFSFCAGSSEAVLLWWLWVCYAKKKHKQEFKECVYLSASTNRKKKAFETIRKTIVFLVKIGCHLQYVQRQGAKKKKQSKTAH